jgi:hypothetical protein
LDRGQIRGKKKPEGGMNLFGMQDSSLEIGELGGFVEADASAHIARFDDKVNLCQQVEKVVSV